MEIFVTDAQIGQKSKAEVVLVSSRQQIEFFEKHQKNFSENLRTT